MKVMQDVSGVSNYMCHKKDSLFKVVVECLIITAISTFFAIIILSGIFKEIERRENIANSVAKEMKGRNHELSE